MTEFDAENDIYGYEFKADNWEETCVVRIDFSEEPRGYKVGSVKYYAVDPELIEQ